MTLQNIVDEMVQEVGGSTSDSTLESILFLCLKVGFRRLPIMARSRIFVKQGSITIATPNYEQAINTTITDFLKERAVWYLSPDLINIRVPILPHRSVQTFHNGFNPNLYGRPIRYIIYNSNGILTIQFDRRVDINLTIGFDYFCSVSGVALTDTFVGDEQIIEGAKGFGYERYYRNYEEDKSKADDNKTLADGMLLQIEGDYESSELGGYVEAYDDY